MINIRIVLASMVTFVLLLGAMSYVTDKGYDKIMPKVEEQKQRALEQQKALNDMMQKGLNDMGVASESFNGEINDMIKQEYPDYKQGVRSLRPIGTWMGIRKGEGNKIAIMKFDKNRYWLMVKDPMGEDIKEKGKYDFQIVEILFYPNGQKSYNMQYDMFSNDGFQLSTGYTSYKLQRTEDVELDF